MNSCKICLSHLLWHSAFLSEGGMDLCHGFMILSTIHLFLYVMFHPTIHTFLLARVHFLTSSTDKSINKQINKYIYIYIYNYICWINQYTYILIYFLYLYSKMLTTKRAIITFTEMGISHWIPHGRRKRGHFNSTQDPYSREQLH